MLQVSIDIYASAEFGCVTIGELNRVVVPNDVQVGCEMRDERVPIVNTTRHWLRYCIEVSSQHHSVSNEVMALPSTSRRYSWGSIVEGDEEINSEEIGAEEFEGEGISDEEVDEEMTYREYKSYTRLEKDTVVEKETYRSDDAESKEEEDEEPEQDLRSFSTMTNQSYDNNTISSAMSSVKLRRSLSMPRNDAERSTPWPFVFAFDTISGELGPNERRYLRLSFLPTESLSYTTDAKCYLTCDRSDYPEIVNALPVVIEGTGCRTRFQVRSKNHHRL